MRDSCNENVTNITFRDIVIHPYNTGYGATTVICDPGVFTTEDLDNLGFVRHDGPYMATVMEPKLLQNVYVSV